MHDLHATDAFGREDIEDLSADVEFRRRIAEVESPFTLSDPRRAPDRGGITIGPACPFCNAVLRDALTAVVPGSAPQLLDIAQITAATLPDPPKRRGYGALPVEPETGQRFDPRFLSILW